jgi:hypothetical protein
MAISGFKVVGMGFNRLWRRNQQRLAAIVYDLCVVMAVVLIDPQTKIGAPLFGSAPKQSNVCGELLVQPDLVEVLVQVVAR